jgi:hypothetical protein
VIKTMEAQLGQYLLGCKCSVSRFLPGRGKDLSAPLYRGYARAQMVEELRYQPDGRDFDSLRGHLNISLT